MAKQTTELATATMTPMDLMARVVDGGTPPQEAAIVLRELMALQREDKADRAREAFYAAVAKFQANCPPVHKGKAAAFGGREAYRYAAYEDIMAAIAPHLRDAGLSISFDTSMDDARMLRCTCYVQHGTHREGSSVTLPMPEGMKVNDTQKAGAALSYARRYALQAALNIVVTGEDVDAHYEHPAQNGAGAPTISAEQEARLSELIEWSGADKAALLKHYGFPNLSAIAASKFKAIEAALVKKGEAKNGGKS